MFTRMLTPFAMPEGGPADPPPPAANGETGTETTQTKTDPPPAPAAPPIQRTPPMIVMPMPGLPMPGDTKTAAAPPPPPTTYRDSVAASHQEFDRAVGNVREREADVLAAREALAAHRTDTSRLETAVSAAEEALVTAKEACGRAAAAHMKGVRDGYPFGTIPTATS